MNKQNLILILSLLVFGLGFVFYNTAATKASDFDVSEMEAKIKELNESLKDLSEEYAALKSNLPVPVEEQLAQMKNKISNLDNIITDQTDMLRKIDPNGLIQDTENWISDSYEKVIDEEESGWSRVRSAEILARFNRMDEEAYNSVKNIFLEGENNRMKAYALGVIKDSVTQDLKEPMMESLAELTENGEFHNGWLMGNIIDASKNLSLNKEDEAKFLYIAQNHPNDRLARRAAELIGVEVENID